MFKTTFTFALKDSRVATSRDVAFYVDRVIDYVTFTEPTDNSVHHPEGATWTEHVDAYTMQDGELVTEPSYSIEIVTENPVDAFGVRVFVDVIKALELQESVMVERNTLVDVAFM